MQQELCGIDHPIAGGIFESEIYNSPFEVNFASYHGLGLEFELAMEISEDLNSKSIKFDENNVLDYISNIYSAFELIIAQGVFSPIAIASPVEEEKLERVTELSATGTCQGPTI